MPETITSEKDQKAELSLAETPHPLASLIGAWKDTEKLQSLIERVEAYRNEIEAKESGTTR